MNNEIKKPLVSIWCATYNHEKYIGYALEGFIKQKTNFSFEVIVHDDASKDGTSEIIKKYQKEYPDIIKPIFQTENQYSQGKNNFRMYGFPKMTGKYVAYCEGDDMWTDCDKLQIQVDFLEKHPEYVACVHNTLLKNMKTGKEININKRKEEYDITFEDFLGDAFKITHLSAVVCRKNILEEFTNNPPPYRLKAKEVGDTSLYWYLSMAGKIRYLPNIMSMYRSMVEGSWSSRHFEDNVYEERVKKVIEVLECLNECTEKKYSERIEERKLEYEMALLYKNAEFRSLLSNRYRKILKKSNISYKFKILILGYAPFARKYCIYRRKKYFSK